MSELDHTTAVREPWFDGPDNRDLAVEAVCGEGGQMSLPKPPPVAQSIQASAPRTEKICVSCLVFQFGSLTTVSDAFLS